MINQMLSKNIQPLEALHFLLHDSPSHHVLIPLVVLKAFVELLWKEFFQKIILQKAEATKKMFFCALQTN